MTAKVDEQLLTAIQGAAARKSLVDAFVQIRPAGAGESAETLAFEVLQRAERSSHQKAANSQYLDLLDSIHVSGSPALLKELIAQPEVLAADAGPSVKGSAMIEPHNAREVSAEKIDFPTTRRNRSAGG